MKRIKKCIISIAFPKFQIYNYYTKYYLLSMLHLRKISFTAENNVKNENKFQINPWKKIYQYAYPKTLSYKEDIKKYIIFLLQIITKYIDLFIYDYDETFFCLIK